MNKEEVSKIINKIKESGGQIIGNGEKPIDGIFKLKYDPSIRQFREHGIDKITISGCTYGYDYLYIHDYYPQNRYDNLVDDNILTVRRLIYDFKDGKNSLTIASLLIDALKKLGIPSEKGYPYSHPCLIVIPGSTPEKTVLRFRTFCESLCSNLGIENGFDSITTLPHERMRGIAGGDKIKYFSFNSTIYKGKEVLLFDDIRTSGTTFKQVISKLRITGATNIMGIFLAKTVSN